MVTRIPIVSNGNEAHISKGLARLPLLDFDMSPSPDPYIIPSSRVGVGCDLQNLTMTQFQKVPVWCASTS